MKKAHIISAAVVLAVAGLSYFAYLKIVPAQPAACQICDRHIPKQTAYTLETKTGTVKACCPACAMHYALHHPGEVREAWATDFNSGRMIPAKTAYYDGGGDVQYCTAHMPPVERGPQGVSERVYDRCLPTLVAFASRDEAEAYRQKHGGRVVTYDQALASLGNE
jgi:hypothetical protein